MQFYALSQRSGVALCSLLVGQDHVTHVDEAST